LHSAKGLEFDTVFLPGWEEGLFPSQRTLDEQGRAGLEEERRLAHVGVTRARKLCKIYFATNRRTHGMWQTNIPSRFLDELPEAHVTVTEGRGGFSERAGYGGYGSSRFDEMKSFGSSYGTPGWQRAQANKARGGFSETGAPRYGQQGVGDDSLDHIDPIYDDDGNEGAATSSPPPRAGEGQGGGRTSSGPRAPKRRTPLTIEGELVAKSTGTTSAFGVGDRVFHMKFGNGNVVAIDGNKLTIAFDKAGEKRVVDSFVERV
jgi:DNA helicase-2/ATP-dependent DNA helicase PcrA